MAISESNKETAVSDIEKTGDRNANVALPATEGDEEDDGEEEEEDEYPNGWKKITVIMVALYLAMFVVALDRTILGTAIPKITDEFHSVEDVGWYASSYLFTACAFQLFFGRVYTFYTPKWILLGALLLFEIGSVVCGAASSSNAFIVGRAIAGVGSAGIFSGCINVMIISIPLHKRPLFQGLFGAVFGVSGILGPVIGGAFTTKWTWRGCFWINVPIGGIVALIIIFALKTPPSKNKDSLRERIMKLDPLGTLFFLPGIISLLLALQWGGVTYAWSSARIIALLVLSAVLLGIFLYIQYRGGDNATIPFHVIGQRSIASAAFFSMVLPGAMIVVVYFLPIWFQAIKGVSAFQSGIDTLPLLLSLVVASALAGVATSVTGYYVSQLIVCSIVMAIGVGLFTTFTPSTGQDKWIGYQVIFGFGLGFGMQQAGMAAQVCLAKKDVMTGVAIMFFMQGLGGSVFIAIAQAVFSDSLQRNFSGFPGLTPEMVVYTGATELQDVVPAEYLPEVLEAYNKALVDVFKVAVGCAAATIISGLTMEWKSVKGVRDKSRAAALKKATANAGETGVEINDGENSNGTVKEVVQRQPVVAAKSIQSNV